MLETDEVDDDYFTPVASTTLANIFGTSFVPKEKLTNETLKYAPPKSEPVVEKPGETQTSCVYACAVTGYEWYNNVYASKGKLGFAVIKVLKSEKHSIILYDSNKTTMSSATISPSFEVTAKGNNYISYYDDKRKYWSLYGTEKEINNTIELLKTLNVLIKTSVSTDSVPPEPNKEESSTEISKKESNTKVESDTDSSINKKNKAAILNRMATMGHSVLPPNTVPIEKSSDSETTDTTSHVKSVRHRAVRNLKKAIEEKPLEIKNVNSTIHSTDIQNVKTFYNDFNHQLIPLPNTSVIPTAVGNDLSLFMTEQRICNSELRINMSRISDKVDQALTKMNDIQSSERKMNNDFNTEILQKLLREYENKIKSYEELLKNTSENSSNLIQVTASHSEPGEISVLKDRVQDLERIIKDKNDYVLTLKNEIQAFKESKTNNDISHNNNSSIKISELEKELSIKNEEISKLRDNTKLKSDVENKIKVIMNEAFQVISNQFEDDESYSGETVKSAVAKIIKNVTKNSLNDL